MRLLLVLMIACIASCTSQQSATNSSLNDHSDIELATRQFFVQDRPGETITGLAYKKIDNDLYLVGTTFKEDPDSHAVNVVVRRFHNGDQTFWKVELLNDRWRQLLRIDE
jgi:hypothetical protein